MAYDADQDGFSEPRGEGRWGWRADAVESLLVQVPDGDLVFFAGCSEEQIEMPFDYRVLLTVPADEIVTRLQTRTSNPYGSKQEQRRQVLADLEHVEPLLRRSADLVLTTTAPVAEVADRLLGQVLDRATRITSYFEAHAVARAIARQLGHSCRRAAGRNSSIATAARSLTDGRRPAAGVSPRRQ